MDNLLENIANYIDILNKDYGLQVSFDYTPFPLPHILFLQKRNILHENPFCSCIKKYGMHYCILQKTYLKKHCGKEPFWGKCFAGVEEYVFPVISNQKTINFVSISGYRSANDPMINFEKLSKRCNVNISKLISEYEKLNTKIPHLEQIKPLIYPLVAMLELYHQQIDLQNEYTQPDSAENQLYLSILNYIAENYRNNITLNDISMFCHYSQSHICNIFKKFSNKSILQFIIDMKLNEGAKQLKNSDKKVCDISYDLGFCDSNYFTNQFKKHFGITPKQYRKQNKYHPIPPK